jgi:hypothetical protein
LTDFEGRDSDTSLLLHIVLADIVSAFGYAINIDLDEAENGVVNQDDAFSASLACRISRLHDPAKYCSGTFPAEPTGIRNKVKREIKSLTGST